jgi:cytochrome d ubiquinol oxidase subunit II
MSLEETPLVVLLVALVAYAVLGGADFGAGFWHLASGAGDRGRAIREHAYHAMGPVWETNHVWLIVVLVVCWTAYPTVFGSVASTLAVPLFVAAVGIILRGTAYVLRAGATTASEFRRIERTFALASILTPFALGAAVGGIASERVPVGNAAGDLVESWLNPTSITIGVLAVATGAYLAAVYLAADAERLGVAELVSVFRRRALAAGVCAGAVALVGLAVVRSDAPRVWHGLSHDWGLAAVLVSAAAGVATLVLLARTRFQASRLSAALAVAAIVAGWAIAQRPELLPGLTVHEAAAGRSTIVALLVALGVGALVLVPSLALLFWLFLRGKFDILTPPAGAAPELFRGRTRPTPNRSLVVPTALLFLLGAGILVLAADTWARALGAGILLVFAVSASYLLTAEILGAEG